MFANRKYAFLVGQKARPWISAGKQHRQVLLLRQPWHTWKGWSRLETLETLIASKENSAVKVTHQAPQSEEKGPVHGCQPAKSAKTPQFWFPCLISEKNYRETWFAQPNLPSTNFPSTNSLTDNTFGGRNLSMLSSWPVSAPPHSDRLRHPWTEKGRKGLPMSRQETEGMAMETQNGAPMAPPFIGHLYYSVVGVCNFELFPDWEESL